MRAIVEVPRKAIVSAGHTFEGALCDWAWKWEQNLVSVSRWDVPSLYVQRFEVEGDDDPVREFLAIVMPYARGMA